MHHVSYLLSNLVQRNKVRAKWPNLLHTSYAKNAGFQKLSCRVFAYTILIVTNLLFLTPFNAMTFCQSLQSSWNSQLQKAEDYARRKNGRFDIDSIYLCWSQMMHQTTLLLQFWQLQWWEAVCKVLCSLLLEWDQVVRDTKYRDFSNINGDTLRLKEWSKCHLLCTICHRLKKGKIIIFSQRKREEPA